MTRCIWLSMFCFLYLSQCYEQDVIVEEYTEPEKLSRMICSNSRDTCVNFVRPVIELRKLDLYGTELTNWTFNEACKCRLPPQHKLPALQYFHIPKCGTSINWFLRDYFDGCNGSTKSSDPCPLWLENEEEQVTGLCDGRLFSCMGHSVHEDLPNIVLNSATNALTFLREPFSRLQSDYHYIKTHPNTNHLGPSINISHLLEFIEEASTFNARFFKFISYPGISNCATKMLNGFQCGDDIELSEMHMHIAKRTLDNFLFYGITELFSKSVCLFAFTYGGQPQTHHFRKFRSGKYSPKNIEDIFTTKGEQNEYRKREYYDIQLYEYALENFERSLTLSRCG